MMRKTVLSIVFFLCAAGVAGQEMSDGWMREFGQEENYSPLRSDTDLLMWLPDGGGSTLFRRMSRHDFNFVSYRHRALEPLWERYRLGGMDVSFTSQGYPDYTLLNALRLASANEVERHGVTRWRLEPSGARTGLTARLNYAERRYRGGAEISAAGALGDGWNASGGGRWRAGEDRFIRGVFTEQAIFWGGIEKDAGRAGRISLTGIWLSSLRGMRSWTTREAFDLAGDNLYNPSWGWWNGRRRNSRVRSDGDFLLTGSYGVRLSASTELRAEALWRSGSRAVSGLAWWDAQNPAPDHYMRLPSYDPQDAGLIDWAPNLCWEDMWYANTFGSGGQSSFILHERVERRNDLRGALTARTSRGRFEADYGVRFELDRGNNFRRAKDMLGGEYVMDYDQYLVDDTAYGSKYRNDLRNPERRVYRSDRFGHDYDICSRKAELFGAVSYRHGRLSLFAEVQAGFQSLWREGYNEKENFAGALSYGRSTVVSATPWAASAHVSYALNQLHHLWGALNVAEHMSEWRDVFLAPDNHNITVAQPENMRLARGELGWRGTFAGAVSVEASAYFMRLGEGMQVWRYWDDIFGEFVSMSLRGVAMNHFGVETAMNADITGRLRLTCGSALGSYRYASGGEADIYADRDMRTLLTGAPLRLEGKVSSPSPRMLAMATLRYSLPASWGVEVSGVWVGGRYISVAPMRRMERVEETVGAEVFERFALQERLPSAAVMNMRLTKSFVIARRCSVFAGVSVNNVLGNRDIIFGGYEQMRIRGTGSGTRRSYEPFPSRYGYSYPRSFQAVLILNIP